MVDISEKFFFLVRGQDYVDDEDYKGMMVAAGLGHPDTEFIYQSKRIAKILNEGRTAFDRANGGDYRVAQMDEDPTIPAFDSVVKCQELLKALEALIGRYTDVPMDMKQSAECLKAHRHGVVSCLFDQLNQFTQVLGARQVSRLAQQRHKERIFRTKNSYMAPKGVRVQQMHIAMSKHDSTFAPRVFQDNSRATDIHGHPPIPSDPVALIKMNRTIVEEDMAHRRTSGELGGAISAVAETAALPAAAWAEGAHVPESLAEELRSEAQMLLNSYDTDIDIIHDTQRKLAEIAGLMRVFTSKVAEQAELCNQITFVAEESTTNMKEAEKHLTKAVQHTSSSRFYIMMFFILTALVLLIADFFTSRSWY